MQYREGETQAIPYRVGRFYCIGEQWYFSCRENLQVGPFISLEMAENGLQNFLRHVDEGGIFAEPLTTPGC